MNRYLNSWGLNRWGLILQLSLVLLLMVGAGSILGQSPAVTIQTARGVLSPPEPEVGERATLTVTPPGDLEITALRARMDGLRIGQFERQTDGSFTAALHPLRDGTFGLEELVVTATTADGTSRELSLTPYAFTVPTPGGEDEPLEDYTGLFAAARTLWKYILAGAIIGIIALAILIGIIILVRRWLRARAIAASLPAPLPAPIDEAMDTLSSLERLEEYQAHGTRAHYGSLSMMLRRYVEREWGQPAMEMSEDEVSDLLRGGFLHRQGVRDLLTVFGRSSLAKFARQEVTVDEVQADLRSSRAFLMSEKERLRAAAIAREANKVRSNQGRTGGREAA